MEDRWRELQERLERLEREAQTRRRFSRAGRLLISALLVISAWWLITTRPTATLLQAGNRISGQAGLQINAPFTVVDAAGMPILRVDAMGGDRGLLLFDHAGRIICGVGVSAQGRGIAKGRGLTVFDADEKLISVLGQGQLPDDNLERRGIVILDPAERIISGMGSSNRGRGLVVHDQSGAWVIGLGVWPQRPDRGQFVLTDRDGHTIFAQPSFP